MLESRNTVLGALDFLLPSRVLALHKYLSNRFYNALCKPLHILYSIFPSIPYILIAIIVVSFKNMFSTCLWLVTRFAIDFCMLIFYPVILLNSVMNFKDFSVSVFVLSM